MVAAVARFMVRLAAALLVCSAAAHARTVQLPADAPFVRFELPDAWTLMHEAPDGVVAVSDQAYAFAVNVAPAITDREDIDAALAHAVAAVKKDPDYRNAEAGEPSDWESDNGVWTRGVRIDAERAANGAPMVMVYHIVEIAAGRYLIVVTNGPADADEAEESNYDAVFASMQAIGG